MQMVGDKSINHTILRLCFYHYNIFNCVLGFSNNYFLLLLWTRCLCISNVFVSGLLSPPTALWSTPSTPVTARYSDTVQLQPVFRAARANLPTTVAARRATRGPHGVRSKSAPPCSAR